jgi:hypothetical protein
MRFISGQINLLTVALLLFLILTHTVSFSAQEQYTYTEITGNRKDSFLWRLFQDGDRIEIESAGEKEKLINICDRRGMTREWMVISPEKNLRVKREGNTLLFSGFQKGIKVDKTVLIDDTPWFQPLSYSLRQFIDLPQDRIEFWHIRTDNLDPVKLAAVKIGLSFGDVCVGQMGYLVKIRPLGVFAPFWQASFWFRSSDKVFCRYEGRHGAWGVPLTVISLDREKQ